MNIINTILTVFGSIPARIRALSLQSKIVLAAILIVLLGGGYYWKSSATKTVTYETEKAERGTLVVSITTSGTVSSASNASVNTQMTGIVKNVFVKNGESVGAGANIAEIELDPSSLQKQTAAWASYLSAANAVKTAEQTKLSLQAQLEQNRQSVLDAQNTLDARNNNSQNPTTKKDYTELERMSIESSLTSSRQTFTATEKKYLDADTSINAARASLSAAWLTYQQSSAIITAPMGGIVSGLSLVPGMVISGSASSSSSSSSNTPSQQKVASITTNAPLLISVNLTEIDVPQVKSDNSVTVTFDSLPDKTFTGTVLSVDTAGSVSSGVTTYPTLIQLDAQPKGIYPNMAATANIITDTRDNVLLVSSSAVKTQNGQSTVQVLKNGQPQSIQVEVGASSDTQTEIISGLSEGDNVITNSTATSTQQSGSTSVFSGTRGFGGGGAVRIMR